MSKLVDKDGNDVLVDQSQFNLATNNIQDFEEAPANATGCISDKQSLHLLEKVSVTQGPALNAAQQLARLATTAFLTPTKYNGYRNAADDLSFYKDVPQDAIMAPIPSEPLCACAICGQIGHLTSHHDLFIRYVVNPRQEQVQAQLEEEQASTQDNTVSRCASTSCPLSHPLILADPKSQFFNQDQGNFQGEDKEHMDLDLGTRGIPETLEILVDDIISGTVPAALLAKKSKVPSDTWLWDSGASLAVCNNVKWFTELHPFQYSMSTASTKRSLDVQGGGTMILHLIDQDGDPFKFEMKGVAFAPNATYNLFPHSKLDAARIQGAWGGGKVTFFTLDRNHAKLEGMLNYVKTASIPEQQPDAVTLKDFGGTACCRNG